MESTATEAIRWPTERSTVFDDVATGLTLRNAVANGLIRKLDAGIWSAELQEWLARKQLVLSPERFLQLRADAIDDAESIGAHERVAVIAELFEQAGASPATPDPHSRSVHSAVPGLAFDQDRVEMPHAAATR